MPVIDHEKDEGSPGLLPEVIDGQFRFANVLIRELKKVAASETKAKDAAGT